MKVTVVNYLHCENDEPHILAVISGGSKAKAKIAALAALDDTTPARIVKSKYSDVNLVLEERFEEEAEPDGLTPWMESGIIWITTHTVE